MDPVTQGVLGASIAQTIAKPKLLFKCALVGALGGMAPDLDILIRSSSDPLLALEFHRHFSHSLFFIPIGALLCAVFSYYCFARRWGLSFRQSYLWSLLGFASHALLDACTTYGTQLLWPLPNQRFAWDTVSVIDPLFTLPLLACVLIASFRQKKSFLWVGLVWASLYMSLGVVQRDRAEALAARYALERAPGYKHLSAKPSFGNLLVWKVIYEDDENYYVDAVRPALLRSAKHWRGASVRKLNIERDLPWLDLSSQQAKDIERFRWFSSGYLSIEGADPKMIIDMRYSMVPNEISALWGIRLDERAANDQHVLYETSRGDADEAFARLWEMIKEP